MQRPVGRQDAMPTTFRFLTRLAILGALAAGAIYALATYVDPTPEPVSIRIAPERFEQ
jgi:hypothetical protein